MPRQPRLDAPGLLQHVMARGIERRKLFKDDKDRKSFLNRLTLILEETQTQCYAWALIPNHFHLFLRTGPTPLSKVMRRLMTGYAVTFNKRHRRSGHLFQNRYKSVVCEEDPYLLELIRYIHLNPLRAGLVNDLKELDKYPWTGHSAILGKKKNPLLPKEPEKSNKFIPLNCSKGTHEGIQPGPNKVKKSTFSPEGGLVRHPCGGFSFSLSSGKGKKKEDPSNPARPVKFEDYFTGVNPVQTQKVLAEKTIEDVLLHFGETKKVARRRYRQFIKKGTDHGTRPELQGGGLVRSAGGNKVGLLGRKKDEREKGDERILGSGDFISNIVQESDNKLQKRTISHPSLKNLIGETAHHFDVSLQALVSRSRNRQVSKARAVISYLAVNEVGYTQEEVSNHLNISRIGVRNSLARGEKMVDICREIWQKVS